MMEPETIAATGYPTADHESFYGRTLLSSGLHAHTGGIHFQQGMFSVVHRHRIASEASLRFADLVSGDPPTGAEEGYRVDSELFLFFTAAVSAVESACWALHGLGAVLAPRVFPMVRDSDLRGVSPASTAARFGRQWPKASDPLSKALDRLVDAEGFNDLLQRRNHLSHRTIPPRTIHVTIYDPGSTVATHVDWDDLRLAPELSASRLDWLTTELGNLWVAGREFMDAREADRSWPPL